MVVVVVVVAAVVVVVLVVAVLVLALLLQLLHLAAKTAGKTKSGHDVGVRGCDNRTASRRPLRWQTFPALSNWGLQLAYSGSFVSQLSSLSCGSLCGGAAGLPVEGSQRESGCAWLSQAQPPASARQ